MAVFCGSGSPCIRRLNFVCGSLLSWYLEGCLLGFGFIAGSKLALVGGKGDSLMFEFGVSEFSAGF